MPNNARLTEYVLHPRGDEGDTQVVVQIDRIYETYTTEDGKERQRDRSSVTLIFRDVSEPGHVSEDSVCLDKDDIAELVDSLGGAQAVMRS